MKSLHVIYVPPDRTVDDVWAEIEIMGRLVEKPQKGGQWAVLRVDDEED